MMTVPDIDSLLRQEVTALVQEDVTYTNYGWVCGTNTDYHLGSKVLCAFNSPTADDDIEYISQFTGDARRGLVQGIYRATNGLRCFGNDFRVPGLRLDPETMTGLDFFNTPSCVSIVSGFEHLRHAPVKGFVLGVCHLWQSGMTVTSYEVHTPDDTIISGLFDATPEVQNTFFDLEDWLISRTRRAHQEFLAAKRRRMN